ILPLSLVAPVGLGSPQYAAPLPGSLRPRDSPWYEGECTVLAISGKIQSRFFLYFDGVGREILPDDPAGELDLHQQAIRTADHRMPIQRVREHLADFPQQVSQKGNWMHAGVEQESSRIFRVSSPRPFGPAAPDLRV